MKTRLIIIALMLGAIAMTLQAQNHRHNIYTSTYIEREDNKMYKIIEKHYPDLVTDTMKRERIEITKTFLYMIPQHLHKFGYQDIDRIMKGEKKSTQEVSWFMIYDYTYDRDGVQKNFSWSAWRNLLLSVLFIHLSFCLVIVLKTRSIREIIVSVEETYSENILIIALYIASGLIASMLSILIFYDHTSSSSPFPLFFAYTLYGIILAGIVILCKSLYQKYILIK